MKDVTPARGQVPLSLRYAGLVLGPLLGLAVYLLLPGGLLSPTAEELGAGAAALPEPARATAALAVWMASWWLTEAVELAVTALLPLIVLPLMGVVTPQEAASPYASRLLFLFLAGFLLGLAMQRSGLHRRIALRLLGLFGLRHTQLLAGFMIVSALLSMWLSNTATVVMLLPIAASLLDQMDDTASADKGFAPALMLGIAYAASIGGMGTLIGTPPNLVLAAYVNETYGVQLSMAQWFPVGLSLVAVMLPLTWWVLMKLAMPRHPSSVTEAGEVIEQLGDNLGPLRKEEVIVGTVFLLTAVGWVTRPWLASLTGLEQLDDVAIGMTGAIALFLIPVDIKAGRFAMDWDTARRVPWQILILFGGGLSLASAISRSGLADWLAGSLAGLADAPAFMLASGASALVVLLTEVTSNTAVASTMMPVLGAVTSAGSLGPGALLVCAALSASCAFMLPVATPPNALVYSSGRVTIGQMVRVGVVLNLIAVVAIGLLVTVLAPYIDGIIAS